VASVHEYANAGLSPENTREQDALKRMLDRLLPEWVRGSKILDNDGEHFTSSSGGEIRVAHGLGRQHRGWFPINKQFFPGTASSNGERGVWEDQDPDLSLVDTHLQLQFATGTRYEYTFDVVIF
jgi:hypothetical protein